MQRRVSRPPPSGFGIKLAVPAQAAVTVQNGSEEEVKRQLFIHGDDSLQSPIIGDASAALHHAPGNHNAGGGGGFVAHAPKFFHVKSTDIYLLVDGGSLFQDSSAAALDVPRLEPSDLLSFSIALGDEQGASGRLRQQLVREMSISTSSSSSGGGGGNNNPGMSSATMQEGDALFEAAIAEVQRRAGNGSHADPNAGTPPPLGVRTPANSSQVPGSTTRGGSSGATIGSVAPLPSTSAVASSSMVGANHRGSSIKVWTAADFDGYEVVSRIGSGTQGAVFAVRLRNGVRCAMKQVDLTAATAAADDVERRGKKSGIVREINMVKSLRSLREQGCRPSGYLVDMYDVTASLKDDKNRSLQVFMELMGSNLESIQRMVGRLPHDEVTKMMQRAFTKHLSGAGRERFFTDAGGGGGGAGSGGSSSRERCIDRQTAVPEIVLSLVAHDVLKGLHELHTAHRRVHCDLKPANILVTEDSLHFKIGDFGCALLLPSDGRVPVRGGAALGSRAYQAPEQLPSAMPSMGNSATTHPSDDPAEVHDQAPNSNNGDTGYFGPAVDVWALGIVLLQLANGCHPTALFQNDFWNYQQKLQLREMILPVTCSNAFYDFIQQCLIRDPSQRPSAAKLQQHVFVTKYAAVKRSALQGFLRSLQNSSEQYQRSATRALLKRSVEAATRTRDPEHHYRQSKTLWKNFTKLVAGEPPSAADERMFPPLGS